MYRGGPWSNPDDMGPQDDNPKLCNSSDPPDSGSSESWAIYYGAHGLLPRKHMMSERDATRFCKSGGVYGVSWYNGITKRNCYAFHLITIDFASGVLLW
ncbi:hypothetical protein PS2_036526 [Malus domestica]